VILLDGCRTGVVGGQSQQYLIGTVFVFGQKVPQVLGAAVGVLGWVSGVDA